MPGGPDAGGPEARAPDAGAPDAGGPEARAPDAGGPEAGSFGPEGPGQDLPGAEGPGAEGPDADLPGAEGPGAEGPGQDGSAGPGSVRERLAAERADTEARIAALSRDFDTIVEANALVAVDDEHDPDGSSTAFERAHVASLLTQAYAHLSELDSALGRLERGEYGRCARCGTPIPPARLEARPATTTCVRCAALP